MSEPKKLYEITMKATKVFYVEAESQQAALNNDFVIEESDSSCGEYDWEQYETEAVEVREKEEPMIREFHADQIAGLKDEEDES